MPENETREAGARPGRNAEDFVAVSKTSSGIAAAPTRDSQDIATILSIGSRLAAVPTRDDGGDD